jgi:hypothetical protein
MSVEVVCCMPDPRLALCLLYVTFCQSRSFLSSHSEPVCKYLLTEFRGGGPWSVGPVKVWVLASQHVPGIEWERNKYSQNPPEPGCFLSQAVWLICPRASSFSNRAPVAPWVTHGSSCLQPPAQGMEEAEVSAAAAEVGVSLFFEQLHSKAPTGGKTDWCLLPRHWLEQTSSLSSTHECVERQELCPQAQWLCHCTQRNLKDGWKRTVKPELWEERVSVVIYLRCCFPSGSYLIPFWLSYVSSPGFLFLRQSLIMLPGWLQTCGLKWSSCLSLLSSQDYR